jgi:peptidoglycan hydrolase CwlO-like protein
LNNKKKLKQFMICLCCVFCSTALTIPYLSYATTQDDLDNANRELESLKAQQQSLSADLSEIDSQLQSAGSRLSSIEEQIDDKQADVDALNEELLSLSQTMDEQYDSMKLRIRYMYERSSSDVIELLLTSQSMSELLLKSEYIYQLSQYDRDMLDEMEANYERQQAAKEQLDTEVAELSSLREEALSEQKNLKALLAKTQQDFDTSSNNVSEAEAAALAYEKKLEEEKLAQEKAEAEAASREAASRAAAAAGNNNSGSSDITSNINKTPISYDTSDLAMLAAIIECEAGNQSYEGKLAVGSVVVNRVNSPRFANSISGVIYASGQFTPVASGRFTIVLSRGASASCVQAAQEVLNGNVTINALYFHVYRSGIDTYGTVIGDHIFY